MCRGSKAAVLAAWRRIALKFMMFHLCAAICAATASGLARNAAAAALSSDAAVVQRGTPGYEALLEKNWVGNVQFTSAAAIVPASLDELRTAVRAARAPVRVVGRGHSFTPVAECSGGTLLSLVITYADAAQRDAVLATGMTGGMETSYARLEGLLESVTA